MRFDVHLPAWYQTSCSLRAVIMVFDNLMFLLCFAIYENYMRVCLGVVEEGVLIITSCHWQAVLVQVESRVVSKIPHQNAASRITGSLRFCPSNISDSES